ncbi:MAG: DapH/DapD/GlmU-related protein [Promethearchaeota archaeon]|jgi:acetyltransferase-like isoleucine patch superfamily enzyme
MNEEDIDTELPDSKEKEEDDIKEDVSLQFHLYIIIFMIIYYFSWVIPGIVFWLYFFIPFRVYFLESLSFMTIFTNFQSLITLLLMPVVIFGCYMLHLFLIGLTTRLLWNFTEKMSPSKSGVIPRNIRSRAANYYHLRSFMIKYGKNTFTKGIFPWLSNWFFNFVGSNKIGKGTTLEESVGMDKFLEIGENCYIGVNSTLTSHLIQGIFGNITYFKISVGDNVTAAAMNQIGPGTDMYDNSFLLPLASTNKHSVVKGGKNYYFGLPLRKIFRKKTMKYLGLSPEDLEKNENIAGYTDKKFLKSMKEKKELYNKPGEIRVDMAISEDEQEEGIIIDKLTEEDLAIDFTTSSAISRVNIKFLAVYLPIFWVSGLLITILWYWFSEDQITPNIFRFQWAFFLLFPVVLFGLGYIFILACILFSKLLLILVNLIHKPKEGVFKAEIRDTDYEFWMLRTELKKITLWFMRNSPLPWSDVLAFKQLGVKMDASSHLNDAWCDAEFIKFGRKNLIGQGATIMSSMVVGSYLIIKNVILGDYVMIGGHTTIAPGTIIGNESVIGALSTTTFDQVCDPNWVYFGIPVIKLKENLYSQERRDIIIKRNVDVGEKFETTHEVNIDEDKKKLIKTEKEVKET